MVMLAQTELQQLYTFYLSSPACKINSYLLLGWKTAVCRSLKPVNLI